MLSRNTLGDPCQECGQPIEREAHLGGSIYLCGSCQELWSSPEWTYPTDGDSRLQGKKYKFGGGSGIQFGCLIWNWDSSDWESWEGPWL